MPAIIPIVRLREIVKDGRSSWQAELWSGGEIVAATAHPVRSVAKAFARQMAAPSACVIVLAGPDIISSAPLPRRSRRATG